MNAQYERRPVVLCLAARLDTRLFIVLAFAKYSYPFAQRAARVFAFNSIKRTNTCGGCVRLRLQLYQQLQLLYSTTVGYCLFCPHPTRGVGGSSSSRSRGRCDSLSPLRLNLCPFATVDRSSFAWPSATGPPLPSDISDGIFSDGSRCLV